MQNGVSSDVYEGERQKKKHEKGKGERRGKKVKEEKKKIIIMRDSPDLGGSGHPHFEGGFPKVLREWIPGFGGKK